MWNTNSGADSFEDFDVATTLSQTITSSQGATVGPLAATAFVTINNLGPDPGPLIVSWSASPPANFINVFGSVTVNPVEDNVGLWLLLSNSGLTIVGPFGQQFAINYA
jgi:hypothetical protein